VAGDDVAGEGGLMRRLFPALVVGAGVCATSLVAFAQDDADPFDALRAPMAEQDRLFTQKRGAEAIAAAREKAKADTQDGWFLLGRALVLSAIQRAESQMPKSPPPEGAPPPEMKFDSDGTRLLDEAREDFERSKEAGGLLYAPAHYGAARVAYAKKEYDRAIEELRQALRISKGFEGAAILLAQSLWEKGLDGDAEFTLYKFLEGKPKNVGAHLLLGKFKYAKHLYPQAEPEFRAAVGQAPDNVEARQYLAMTLLNQEKLAESAQHWETVRRALPKDDQSYVFLFKIYFKLKKRDLATVVLNDCVRERPDGPFGAPWANAMLEQMKADPKQFDGPGGVSLDDIKRRLDSKDHAEVLKALEDLRPLRLSVLPHRVYALFYDPNSTPAERLAAVRLVVDLAEPQTLGVLEVMLAHPSERERDVAVRQETAHAISVLPTDAIVPVLFEALSDGDVEVREWAVKGIAARTGKYFRSDLGVRTPADQWPAEHQLYMKWWGSTSASAAKRSAMQALDEIYGPIEKGSKARVARYALPAMEDPIEATWRAGYDVFRMLTFRTWGAEQGIVVQSERQRITNEARQWLAEEMRNRK
jgi:tetratricopeptide (TPR) repeat protein